MSFPVTPLQFFSVVSPLAVIAYFFFAGQWLLRRASAQVPSHRDLIETQGVFVSKALLTKNEQEFFGRLKKACSILGLEVVPQVSMGALVDVSLPKGHPLYWPLRHQFSQKIIDFVVYKGPDMEVLTVVELDDKTHDAARDRKRDALMAQAGFKTIRWESKAKPDVSQIVKAFAALKNP